MDGTTTMTVRAAVAALALLAHGGSISGVSAAEGSGGVQVAAAIADQAALPRFEPSFAESFEPFAEPAPVALARRRGRPRHARASGRRRCLDDRRRRSPRGTAA
jgi:hypothetical protein